MQSVAWSKSFATTLLVPHNQSAHLSTQTPFYKHYPSSSSTRNPSFLPRSTCPHFSQPSFSPDEIHKEPDALLSESNTMSPHFKIHLLPITLRTKELLQTIPQSTKPKPRNEPFKSTQPSHNRIGYNVCPPTSHQHPPSALSIVAALQALQADDVDEVAAVRVSLCR